MPAGRARAAALRVVVAPDSLKGSLTALEVCQAACAGITAIGPQVECVGVPMADGGEGTVQSVVDATSGRFERRTVRGPLGDPVSAEFGLVGGGRTAVIEMAAAAGLPLVPPAQRNPLHTTTYGVGELIGAALDLGVAEILLGIGGSATTDAGLGVAAALGARLYDDHGTEVPPTGEGLTRLARVDVSGLDPRLEHVTIRVACDVDNPLYGPRGAAHVYGPQKGATPATVEVLDAGLQRFAAVVERDLGLRVAETPGAGAAGGLGAGLMAFCHARLEPGVAIVIDAVGLREQMAGASLCLTGEGRLDRQTLSGKTPAGVAEVAREHGVPVIALGGSIETDVPELGQRFDAVFSLATGPQTLEQAMAPEDTQRRIAFVAQQVVRCFVSCSHTPPG